MEKRKSHVSLRISTFLLCIPAILLCAPSHSQANDYDDGGIWNIYGGEYFITVSNGTTVNLYASVTTYVSVGPGSFLNIYSGSVGSYITVNPSAVVTVYGTGFGGDGDFGIPGQVTFTSGSGTLTGLYGDGSEINLFFYSIIPIYLAPPETSDKQVDIDIKPGSSPNSINLKSKGVLPVAVLTTQVFDATTIDPDTVEFAGASPLRWTWEDADDDGDVDMLFHFKTQELNLDENSTEATLTSETFGGNSIIGTDEVRIIPRKK